MNNDNVFLHGLWRTHTTFFWKLFRDNPDFMAFYEPLHHNLASRTQEQCEVSHTSKPKDLMFRHPHTEEHYFREFPLRPEGGIEGFSLSFCSDSFIRQPNSNVWDSDEKLLSYLRSLEDIAAKTGKCAALKENRSWLRAGFLKKHLGGIHIYLDRAHDEIYSSSVRFVDAPYPGQKADDFFITSFVMVLGRNSEHPLFKPMADYLGVPHIEGSYDTAFSKYSRFVGAMPRQGLYDLIAFHAAAGRAHALQYADIFVDTDCMSDPAYQNDIKKKFVNLGIYVPVETFNPPAPLLSSGMHVSAAADIIINDAVGLIKTDFDMSKFGVAANVLYPAQG